MNLLLGYLFSSTHVSDAFSRFQEVNRLFWVFFYSCDCFGMIVVLFNSKICVYECSVRVDCLWQTFVSLDVTTFFFFLQECILCVCSCQFLSIYFVFSSFIICQVTWSCRIHGLLLCRGVIRTSECHGWRGSSNAGALGGAEYTLIAIAPKSTLARSSSTC